MENDIVIKPYKPNDIRQIDFCVAKVKYPNDLILKVGTKEECEQWLIKYKNRNNGTSTTSTN